MQPHFYFTKLSQFLYNLCTIFAFIGHEIFYKTNKKGVSMSLKSFYGVGAAVVSAVLLFSGCAGNAHIEKDKTVDFSQYHTYAWLDKPEIKEEKKSNKD